MADDYAHIDVSQVEELKRRIDKYKQDAANLSKPVKLSAVYMLRQIDFRFRNSGPNNEGQPWKGLAPSTLFRKTHRGHAKHKSAGGVKPLMDTGYMRKSVHSVAVGDDAVRIQAGAWYAKFHHPPELSGHPITTGKIPNRAFMYHNDEDDRTITGYFEKNNDSSLTAIFGKPYTATAITGGGA